MSRILLVDTNLAAWPIHRFLLALGHEVYVVGGNPHDYLAQASQHYIRQDYADLAAMQALIERLGIELLVPGCNDFSYAVCARLNEQNQFHGIDSVAVTDIINHKEKFRRFAQDNGIPVPRLLSADAVQPHNPVIVKPVDAFSGRGITVLQKPERTTLEEAVDNARSQSRSGCYIIEEYVSGPLYSHSAFIAGQRILQDFFVEEHCIASPFAVDTSRVVTSLPAAATAAVRAAVERMAGLLKLVDGLFHTQFILQGDKVWFVEVTRRCPGDLYSLLIEYSTGCRYAEMYTLPFLQQPLVRRGDAAAALVVRHTITLPVETRFTGLSFQRNTRLLNYFSLARSGDLIGASPFGRIGIFFTASATAEEQNAVYRDLIQREFYVVE